MPEVLQEHVVLELFGIGQVAVVGKHQTKGRIDIEGLRLGRVVRRAGGRIPTVRDAPVAIEVAHVARPEHVADHARTLVHVEAAAVLGRNAGSILPAMLQHLQTVV